MSLLVTRKDDRFRQLGENPSYQTDAAASYASTVHLEKLLPEAWGVNIPVTVQHSRSTADPFYVRGGDVRADALQGLRRPQSSVTTYEIAFRRARRGQTLLEHLLLDPLVVTARRQSADAQSELNRATTTNRQVRVAYANLAGPRTIRALPGFLVKLVDGLPRFLRDSDWGRAIRTARLRWNPYQLRLGTTLINDVTDRLAFRMPISLVSDTAIAPLKSVVHTLRHDAALDLRPFSSLLARVDYQVTRDLQDYGDSSAVTRLLQQERRGFLGTDLGFERSRILGTVLNAQPVLSSWLSPRIVLASTFSLTRDPGARVPVRAGGDSAAALRVPLSLANSRRRELGSTVDLGRLARNLFGDHTALGRLFHGLLPADVSYVLERRSGFDRAPFDATFRYQLGLGGLDDFRVQGGVPATATTQLRMVNASGGLQSSLGLRLRLNYADLETQSWARRADVQSEITQRSTEWPSGTVSWLYTPRWGLRKVLSGIATQTQYRHVVTSSVQPSFAGAGPIGGALGAISTGPPVLTENRSTTVAPSLTLTWVGGIVTSGQYSRATGDALTSGNVTRSDRTDWAGNINFSFRAPRSLVRLPSALRSAIALASSDILVCLVRAGSEECVPVSDSRRRRVDLRLDTGFSPEVTGGASFGYVLTDQRHTSTRFSQMIFTIFVEINFRAGQIR